MRVLVILLTVIAIGCGKQDAPLAAADQRIHEIIKQSNGNWDALSEPDKATLIQELGRGDETSARVSFKARTSVGGPPVPGSF